MTRFRGLPLKTRVLLLLAFLAFATSAAARHRRSSDGEAGIFVTCGRQDVPRLREVHICLDRDLSPRACSADAARGAYRAATLIVPPIR